ncbi:hypothetical protein H0H87_005207 [Tephrocybe sp. NHM501043]|nr:hypothetical protein H0H87_005207 [Tephrocybe sp. NHM501043]
MSLYNYIDSPNPNLRPPNSDMLHLPADCGKKTTPRAPVEDDSDSMPAPVDDTPDVSNRLAALSAQNIILQHRVDTLENMVLTMRREMSAVKHALGPWIHAPNPVPLPRYYSTEVATNAQPATASTSAAEQQPEYRYPPQTYSARSPPSSLPSAESLAAYFPEEHEVSAFRRPRQHQRMASNVESYEGYSLATHPLVAPLNLGTTLEGSLYGLRESVVGLAMGVDALGRRQDIALTNEAQRTGEEMGGLRAQLHGLRMQMHGLMMAHNAQLTGRDGVENVNVMHGQWIGPAPRGFYGQAGSATKL